MAVRISRKWQSIGDDGIVVGFVELADVLPRVFAEAAVVKKRLFDQAVEAVTGWKR